MVQVLPHVPGFGERLVDSLLKAGGNVAEGLQKKFKTQGLQSILKGLQQPGQVDPNAAAQSQGQPYQNTQMQPGTIRQPNLAETAAIAEGIEGLYGKSAADAVLGQLSDQRKLADKEAMQIRMQDRKEAAEQKKQIQERKEKSENFQKVFNSMSSLLAKNTPGVGISVGARTGLSRKAVEGRNTFNAMRAKIESVLLPMVNKGSLAKERFNFIMSQVPEASESQRAIAGKLRGLSSILGEEGFPIDTKVLDSIPWVSEELKNPSNQDGQKPPLESFFK